VSSLGNGGSRSGVSVVGDQLPDPADQPGARTFAEHDEWDEKRSKASQFRRTAWRHAGDLVDATKSNAKLVEQGMLHRPPTGQATATPTGPTVESAQKNVAIPDLVTGFVVGAVMVLELVRRMAGNITKGRR